MTLYPFCSNNILRVASRTASYETESIRLGIVPAATFWDAEIAPVDGFFLLLDFGLLGGMCRRKPAT